ncbi:MAG: hypothetical protein AAGF23_04015 [Acidobacteriota bacterium]
MADPLEQYSPPAGINDFPRSHPKRDALRAAWDAALTPLLSASTDFYDPKVTAIGDAKPVKVEWTAFPKQSEDRGGADRFEHADGRQPAAQRQWEYCEWCVQRNAAGDIVRATFTTEDINYWRALWQVDPACVLQLYRFHVSGNVQMDDLRLPSDPTAYNPFNKWNTGDEYTPTGGGSMHMIVGINHYPAAIRLVKNAAASPEDAPRFDANRADPVVILATSRVVGRLGLRLSFSDPVGVYLQEPAFHRFELPLSAPPDLEVKDLWRVVRGKRSLGQGLRAVFSVPKDLGFTVSDIRIDGEPIRFGSQIATTVQSATFLTPLPRS